MSGVWDGRGEQKSTPTGESQDSIRALSRPAGSAYEDNIAQNTSDVNRDNFDVDKYVAEQTKKQARGISRNPKEAFSNMRAEIKHALVDDAVAYEKYFDKLEKAQKKSTMREGVDNKTEICPECGMVEAVIAFSGSNSNKNQLTLLRHLPQAELHIP